MRKFGKVIENIVLIAAIISCFSITLQVVWPWRGFDYLATGWVFIVLELGCLLVLYSAMQSHAEFLSGKKTFKLEKYSEKSVWFRFRTTLIYLSAFLGTFILVMGGYENIVQQSPDSLTPVAIPLWQLFIAWLILSLPMMNRGAGVDQESEQKEKEKKQQADKVRAEELKVLKQNTISELQEKQSNSEAKEKELAKEMKKVESKIKSERDIILKLYEKYPFIGEIAPNRVK